MEENNNNTINRKFLSDHDQNMIKGQIAYLEDEDRKQIAQKFKIKDSYVRTILSDFSTNRRKDVFNFALQLALQRKKAHLKSLKKMKEEA